MIHQQQEQGPLQTVTYWPPWPTYALDWSSLGSDHPCLIALSSFNIPSVCGSGTQNYIRLLGMDEEAEELRPKGKDTRVDKVVSMLRWCPARLSGRLFLGAAGLGLSIYALNEEGNSDSDLLLRHRFIPSHGNPNKTPPFTSLSWCPSDPSLVLSACYDTTCSVWSLETGALKHHLIAHDRNAVLDAAWTNLHEHFISAGADGTIRSFDLRY